jgi:hypothetical protein
MWRQANYEVLKQTFQQDILGSDLRVLHDSVSSTLKLTLMKAPYQFKLCLSIHNTFLWYVIY